MADLSITAGNVLKTSGSVTNGIAGATITAGQSVYLDTTTNKWKLAQCDGTAAEAGSGGIGVALNGASDGQPLQVLTAGPYNPGATVTVGQTYVVPRTAGNIAPISDLASTDRVTLLGVATTASELTLAPNVSGVVKP
jgi:hypothetical protein